MIIFGVDPGTILTGFGIIKSQKTQTEYIHSGIIKPNPQEELALKLKFISLYLLKFFLYNLKKG